MSPGSDMQWRINFFSIFLRLEASLVILDPHVGCCKGSYTIDYHEEEKSGSATLLHSHLQTSEKLLVELEV